MLISSMGALFFAVTAATPAHAGNNYRTVICRSVKVRVAPSPGQTTSNTVSGEFCATADELVTGKTAQLLIHGVSYNHDYWNFGKVDGIEYSFARDVAAHGFP